MRNKEILEPIVSLRMKGIESHVGNVFAIRDLKVVYNSSACHPSKSGIIELECARIKNLVFTGNQQA
jgi:hypothetical protein